MTGFLNNLFGPPETYHMMDGQSQRVITVPIAKAWDMFRSQQLDVKMLSTSIPVGQGGGISVTTIYSKDGFDIDGSHFSEQFKTTALAGLNHRRMFFANWRDAENGHKQLVEWIREIL